MAAALAILGVVFWFAPNEGGPAIMLLLPLVALVSFIIYRLDHDRKFLLRLFLSAVLVRVLIGTFIYIFHMQTFFGGDAFTFDVFGWAQLKVWEGEIQYIPIVEMFSSKGAGSGWGMLYLVAVVYKIVGQNMLATQYVNCVIGAASAVVAYLISIEIFPNRRIARLCALMAAFYPSLVLWSCQGLKDGPIVLLLTLTMLATLKLGEKFSLTYHHAGAGSMRPADSALLCFLHHRHRGRCGLCSRPAPIDRSVSGQANDHHNSGWPGPGIFRC
jgi:hypothetical protein